MFLILVIPCASLIHLQKGQLVTSSVCPHEEIKGHKAQGRAAAVRPTLLAMQVVGPRAL